MVSSVGRMRIALTEKRDMLEGMVEVVGERGVELEELGWGLSWGERWAWVWC